MGRAPCPHPDRGGGQGWRLTGLACGPRASHLERRQRRDIMDDQTRIELEAAAFRTLRDHLMEKRTDVQNIDLMNLAGFCRNCLSRWYQEEAATRGIEMGKEEAREVFYGMPYGDWKDQYQTEATAEQQKDFKDSFAANVG